MSLPSVADVRTERYARDYERFVRHLEPSFDLQWFHRRLCAEIQEWATCDDPYVLILQLPPGHAKSTYAKMACAWQHGRDPDTRIVYTSYGQELASEHCGDIQEIMFSERYRTAFPKSRINDRRSVNDKKRGARRTHNRHDIIGYKGRLVAVGTGGPITGGRYDWGVIDDPVKGPEEAANPSFRNKQWNWLTRTLLTRKRPGRPFRLLLLLTRWNLDDLAGRIQREIPDGCRVVSFPALKETDDDPHDPREIGEALWDAVETREGLEKKRELDPSGFASLYQQRPVPEGGAILKSEHMQHWQSLPGRRGTWIQSWDLRAGGKGAHSSYVVGQLWFRPEREPANVYLVDQRRDRWDAPDTARQLVELSKDPLWSNAGAILVEDKADGRALIPMLRNYVSGILPISPIGSKEARAHRVAPYFAAGNVYLPPKSIAPWVGEYITEVITFPGGAHDDQVDATTQAVDYLLIGDEPDAYDPWSAWR